MRRNLILVAALALSLPGVMLAQRDRSARAERRHRHDYDDRGWLDRCRDRDDSWGGRDRSRYCEERTMGWRSSAGQSLTVDASPNGGVSVTGWDNDSVDVIVKIQTYAGSDSQAHDLANALRVVNDHGTLRVEGPGSRRWASWAVSFEIRAPKRVDVDLRTENGPLAVEDITGRLRLSAQNGPLALDGVSGDVQAHAQNGPLTVSLVGSRWEGAGLDAETQNGPLVLEVPDGYNAELETGTVNGPLDIGFPITVQGRIGMGSRRRIQTTLGSGGPHVRAVTTNGPAVLRRS